MEDSELVFDTAMFSIDESGRTAINDSRLVSLVVSERSSGNMDASTGDGQSNFGCTNSGDCRGTDNTDCTNKTRCGKLPVLK